MSEPASLFDAARIAGRQAAVSSGFASGAIAAREPASFWGGFELTISCDIDSDHDLGHEGDSLPPGWTCTGAWSNYSHTRRRHEHGLCPCSCHAAPKREAP